MYQFTKDYANDPIAYSVRFDAIRFGLGLGLETLQIVMFVRANILLLPDRRDKSIAIPSDCGSIQMCVQGRVCVCVSR